MCFICMHLFFHSLRVGFVEGMVLEINLHSVLVVKLMSAGNLSILVLQENWWDVKSY